MEPTRRLATAAGCLVLAVALGTWLLSGVALADALLFLGYHAAWVVLPGVALHGVLVREAGALERLGVGWALGYAVAIGAFHLTAALGVRWLFFGVPLLSLLALLRRPRVTPDVSGAAVAGLAAVAVLAIVFQALVVVPLTPLPGTTSAAYPPDPMFHLSVAAEARHHFPVTDPKVSGTALPYHLFAHYDMAGVSQVTGVELPVTVLRLVFVPLTVLTVVLVGLAAAGAGATRLGVPLAAALYLFVGEIDLQPDSLFPFWGGTFFGLAFSPSFLLSVPLFGALLTVVRRLVVDGERGRGLWLLCAVLVWALGGAKAGSLAVVVGGCLLYTLVSFLRARTVDRAPLAVAGVAAGVSAVQVFVLYGGAGSGGVEFRLLGAVRSASAVEALDHWLAVVGPIGTLLAWSVGLAAMIAAPLLVAALAPRDRPVWTLYAALWATGLLALLALAHPGSSQLHLMQLGLVAGAALGGVGLERLEPSRALLALCAALLVGIVTLAYLPSWVEGADAHGLRYGGLVVLVALVVAAERARRARVRAALAAVAIVAALVNVPLDTIAPLLDARRDGVALSAGDDVTPELYAGLTWIRDNTPEDAVLAVNNQSSNRGRFDNFVYSALSERRVFLEGWLYSVPSVRGTYADAASGRRRAFGDRQALNNAALDGEPDALETLASRYGVRYVVLDKLHGSSSDRARGLGRIVFTNRAVDVVELG